jgi:hypothetical protein
MSFLDLPIDLLYEISEHILSVRDLNAFVRTSRQLHQIFNHHLYRDDVEYYGSSALLRAAARGNIDTLNVYFREQIEPFDMLKVQAAMSPRALKFLKLHKVSKRFFSSSYASILVR